jgi:hypothetical protein
MAKDLNSGINIETQVFNKGLVRDYDDIYVPEGAWSHARNLVNNSVTGEIGVIGNEEANKFCTAAPYTIIGAINLRNDEWVIMSTNDVDSEIGYFKESQCQYYKIVNDSCLGFKRTHLITGISKENFDCSWQIYFADNLNSDRTLNIGNIDNAPFADPWPGVPYICEDVNPDPYCVDCQPKLPLQLDCEKIKLAKLMSTPCVSLSKGPSGGTLPNGSYYAVVAYTVNQQKVTDYFTPSNVQTLFEHDNLSGALQVSISGLEQNVFSEFELVIVSTVNQQTSAKRIGYYNTKGIVEISIDYINEALPAVPIEQIPIQSPVYEKSEAIFKNGPYALRVAPTGKFDFNYQPLANQIEAEWVMVEQPIDYYRKGGNQTGYMRDEQYAFWIRWVYNTGDKSSSYHIPGRAKRVGLEIDGAGLDLPAPGLATFDNVELQQSNLQGGPYEAPALWEMINTAFSTSFNIPADGNPVISNQEIARGKMGYWESTETYPNNKPEVWANLCGKPVRHHKMPADIVDISASSNGNPLNFSRVRTDINGNEPIAIRILGVEFLNIAAPVDNDGNLIPGIVGYEILRSSREGNKTVVAKGIINNMRYYQNADNQTVYYQNYPYNPLGTDPSLTRTSWTDGTNAEWNNNLYDSSWVSQTRFTFHSPDTQFKNPFLSAQEFKFYGEVGAANNVLGNFEEVPGHPKHKLPTDMAFIISMVVGISLAGKAVHGKETSYIELTKVFNAGITGVGATGIVSAGNLNSGLELNSGSYDSGLPNSFQSIGSIAVEAVTSVNPALAALKFNIGTANAELIGVPIPLGGGIGGNTNINIEKADIQYGPVALQAIGGLITYAQYMSQGADATLDIIRGFSKYQQYALRYLSHGNLHKHRIGNVVLGNSRRFITNDTYLENQLQNFDGATVNNAYRGRCVALRVEGLVTSPSIEDNTVQIYSSARDNGLLPTDVEKAFQSFNTTACSYYGGMKLRIRNQYGQLESVRQIPTGCIVRINPLTTTLTSKFKSGILFGGDIYVGRYTEKNTFFYFYDWLMNMPDGTEFDYRLRTMVANPRFWVDFTKFDTTEFLSQFIGSIASANFADILDGLPSNNFNLDNDLFSNTGLGLGSGDDLSISEIINLFGNLRNAYRLIKKNAWFYLFQSGVRDFVVESEINVDLRDWGNTPAEYHYDEYRRTDLRELFAPEIIKAGNFFKYDLSLSVSRLFNNFISWGNMQPRYYDPLVAETCYTYYKTRMIYSLPQLDVESVRDNWQVYLANNYKEFISQITAVKPIGKNGAIIFFKNDSPVQFLGTESLELDAGTKVTVGDGTLFSQALQNLSSSDPEYQHGACQNRLAIVNTPAGIYYMAQEQGKIFAVDGNGLKEISASGMRWWFNKYLPYTLLEDFPEYPLTDNPVVGIGCQTTYDNSSIITYFCKKDYKLREEYKGRLVYRPKGDKEFLLDNLNPVALGDPIYFENTSWTVSYDPKNQMWVSFHDWHPELTIGAKNEFLTTITNAQGQGELWRHNDRSDLFCNFYGQDYPFEVEYISKTGQTVNSLKSLEYILECYTYNQYNDDLYHVLDFNFDHAVLYNTEQVSGLLNLVPYPKNNVPLAMSYPIINLNSIDVLYQKVEQKYRINQFWDITRDRGEFTYPNVQQPIWLTEHNGYIRNLNANNLNYAKPAFERKKFRHYVSHVLLTRNLSGAVKMILKLTNNKNLNSPR